MTKELKKINSKNNGLTKKNLLFIQEYLVDLNGKQAAIRAGYEPKHADTQASRMLANAKVQAAIYRAQRRLEKRVEAKQERVLKELAMIGFADLKDFVDYDEKTGLVTIKNLDQIKKGETRVLKSVTATQGRRKGKHGEELIFEKRKVELCDKIAALKLIGEHIGMFDQRLTIEGALRTENKLIVEVVPAMAKPQAKELPDKSPQLLPGKTDK